MHLGGSLCVIRKARVSGGPALFLYEKLRSAEEGALTDKIPASLFQQFPSVFVLMARQIIGEYINNSASNMKVTFPGLQD